MPEYRDDGFLKSWIGLLIIGAVFIDELLYQEGWSRQSDNDGFFFSLFNGLLAKYLIQRRPRDQKLDSSPIVTTGEIATVLNWDNFELATKLRKSLISHKCPLFSASYHIPWTAIIDSNYYMVTNTPDV